MMLNDRSRHSLAATRESRLLLLVGLLLSPLLSLPAQTPSPDVAGPVITLWTGQDMTFGGQGIPQPILNILGNVSGGRGVASLNYSLNGRPTRPLSIGPDTRRLARPGDFNIDINADILVRWPQLNTVVITATDSMGGTSSVSVKVTNRTPSRWPLPFEVSWSSPSSLGDSAQVTDGKWSWTPGGITSEEQGYDRLVAIGDTGWTDYEVTAELTVVELDTSNVAYDETNGGPSFGLVLHWNGHTDKPTFNPPITQPLSGYLPYGVIGSYHWRRGAPSGWELLGNNLRILAQDTLRGIEIGVVIMFKMRVVTLPGVGQAYYLKHWKATNQEPEGWQLGGLEDTTSPRHGSCLLYAHHVKGLFGRVTIQPLGQEIVVTGIESLPGPNSAYVTWKTNARSSGRILYGKSLATPDTARGDTLSSTLHQVLLPDLTPSTHYQFRVESTAAEGTTIRPAQSSFLTRANQPPLAFTSDTFGSTALDSARWVFINPDPPSELSLVQNTDSRAVSIAVPAGSSHDIWPEINVPRIMQPAANMDFQAEVKFLSLPNSQYQFEGILMQQDFANFIRFDFFSDASRVSTFTASFEGGVPTVRGTVEGMAQSPVFLRVTRTETLWKTFFSHDSLNWTAASSFTSAMRMNAIGIYSGNAPGQNSVSPAFTCIIDQITNLAEKATDVPLVPGQRPLSFALEQNYPNPFNPLTIIKYTVGGNRGSGIGVSDVSLVVYDVVGRQVAVLVNERKPAGSYEVTFDGSSLSSGVYYCRFKAGGFTQSRSMILVK